MVSSKNRNHHRNHGCNLVEIAFAVAMTGDLEKFMRPARPWERPGSQIHCEPADYRLAVAGVNGSVLRHGRLAMSVFGSKAEVDQRAAA